MSSQEQQEEREDWEQNEEQDEAGSKESQPVYQVMSAPTLTPPGPFDFAKPRQWPDYATRFARYVRLSHLRNADEETKIDTLLYEMGKAADQAMRTFNPQPKSLKATLESFGKYFYPKQNVIFKRTMFVNRNQGEHEPAESFIRSVYELADECNYDKMKDELIRDRLIAGMQDQQLSSELQLDDSITLEKVCSKLRQKEQLHQESIILQQAAKPSPTCETSSVLVRNNQVPNSNPKSLARCPPTSSEVIGVCVAAKLRATVSKRALLATIAAPEVHHSNEDEIHMECQEFILGIKEVAPSQAWTATLNVGAESNKVNFKLDTGADETIISLQEYNLLPHKPVLSSPKRKLVTVSGSTLDAVGVCKVIIKRPQTQFSAEETIYVKKAAATKVAEPKFARRSLSPQRVRDQAAKDRLNYDWRHHKAHPRPLQQGTKISINCTNTQGQVQNVAPRPRSSNAYHERGSHRRYKHQSVQQNSPSARVLPPRKGEEVAGPLLQAPLAPPLSSSTVWLPRYSHLDKKSLTK
ncbi:hypothetical protein B566_EDAN017150 [Ephemera danica]|nr:hypothetical protein B566_EDAN017150 [Ephemera danica]